MKAAWVKLLLCAALLLAAAPAWADDDSDDVDLDPEVEDAEDDTTLAHLVVRKARPCGSAGCRPALATPTDRCAGR